MCNLIVHMTQTSLHFSSKNREKVGKSEAHDFAIKFNPVLTLSSDMTHGTSGCSQNFNDLQLA